MHDPYEGITPEGTIVTGVNRSRVTASFEPVISAAISAIDNRDISLYLYGSVATGMAVAPTSDVDLMSIGLPPAEAAAASTDLSAQFSAVCRNVTMGAAQLGDFGGDDDESYGNRVFLRHYCAHLAGPDLHSSLPAFAADARAARGFNGDIGKRAHRWLADLQRDVDPRPLSRRLARKALLAVAGLVSIQDQTWTTDRTSAAQRWAIVRPEQTDGLQTLTTWSEQGTGDPQAIRSVLDGVVSHIVADFESTIGLWPDGL